MLLEFKTENYKSFWEETLFSMIPASRQTGLDYSIFNMKVGSKQYKGLSSAVVYGPNAAGKTNLIGAMDTMRMIVLRGNIRNQDVKESPNAASHLLELVPNCDADSKPTKFGIRFVHQDTLVDYSFSADFGRFMEKDYPRKIIREDLKINEKRIFEREEKHLRGIEVSALKSVPVNAHVEDNHQVAVQLAESGLNEEELFLCNGFKTIFSKELVSLVLDWVENHFLVVYHSAPTKAWQQLAGQNEEMTYVENIMNEAAREFGITSNALGYKMNAGKPELVSVFQKGSVAPIPAEWFESYGTVRFMNEFSLILRTLMEGSTLVMDALDESIHPMALMNLIHIFHNDDLNKKHAQLIFNTHNPIFLNGSLFRRDEIKFVERDRQTYRSHHYALSDFKTSAGVRKGEDYLSNYFAHRYGAIEDIDFAPMVERLIASSDEDR